MHIKLYIWDMYVHIFLIYVYTIYSIQLEEFLRRCFRTLSYFFCALLLFNFFFLSTLASNLASNYILFNSTTYTHTKSNSNIKVALLPCPYTLFFVNNKFHSTHLSRLSHLNNFYCMQTKLLYETSRILQLSPRFCSV